MRPFICAASLLAFVALACLAAGSAGAQDDKDETPTVKEIMKKLHGREKNSPLNNLKAALKGDSPDWEAVQKDAKTFKKYGDALAKTDPPRGKKAAYEKLAKAYASSAKTLEESAEKENIKGARDALKKIQNSCSACHKSHRPN